MTNAQHLSTAWLCFLFAAICWGAYKGSDACRTILVGAIVVFVPFATIVSIIVLVTP
jgi:hypothetical protein